MSQYEYDNQEERFSSDSSEREEKHQALTDVIMSDMLRSFQDDATEVLFTLAERIRQMALGNVDGEALVSVIDGAINAPFHDRHEPINRFIIDAIYAEALEIAELDL